ncbi:MAG: DUF1295 domain-containing protein [Chloroflexi bacterium]|nr:DUF1295 domain-containing protein [Chloroflexota bacterium]
MRVEHWHTKPWWEKGIDILVGSIWVVYAALYLSQAWMTRSWANGGLFLFYTLVAFLFIFRRPARRRARWWQTALALGDAIWPVVWLRPTGHGVWLGTLLQGGAMLIMLMATLSLGWSFGIAPADRGLQTRGLYRWVRHPLYAGELLFYLGYCTSHPSWHNLVGMGVSLLLVWFRMRWEEAIIQGYEGYARRVPWRLVPGVW